MFFVSPVVLETKPPLLLVLGVQVLVQVGDVLDRGDDEIAILSLLACLNKQAHSKGGAVFQVLFFSLCFFTELRMLHNIATTNCLNPKPTPSSMKIILCLIKLHCIAENEACGIYKT